VPASMASADIDKKVLEPRPGSWIPEMGTTLC
jgi:hypothetical protein